MGFGVWGLGFRVWGLGFGVWGLGFIREPEPKRRPISPGCEIGTSPELCRVENKVQGL